MLVSHTESCTFHGNTVRAVTIDTKTRAAKAPWKLRLSLNTHSSEWMGFLDGAAKKNVGPAKFGLYKNLDGWHLL